MSDVVRIELDRRDATYRAGEVVSGSVVVDGAAGRRARKVVLRTWWETRGKGTSVRGGKRAVVLHEGRAPDGATHRHPFRFVAPDAPFTYQGHHLAVDHLLQALIELPMAPDAEVELPFRVVPGASVGPPPDELVTRDGTPPPPPRPNRAPAIVGALLLGIGVVTLPVPGFFLALVGAGVLGFGLRKEIAASRAGKVTVEVEPRVAAPGDDLEVRIGILPPKPVAIQGVTATLRAREICVSGSGNSRKTHRHVAHVEEKAVTGQTMLPAQLKRALTVSFTIPDLGIWSFKAHRNEVRWDVVVRVRIASWPDWVGEVPVVVWPARRLAGGDAGAVALVGEGTRSVEGPQAAGAGGRIQSGEGRARARETEAGRAALADPTTTETSARVLTPPPPPTRTRASAPAAHVSKGVTTRKAPTPPAAEAPKPSAPDAERLRTAVEAILATRSHSPERKAALASLVGARLTIDLVVDRIDRPFGRTRVEGFEDGRIVKGRVAGTSLDVEARVPTAGAARVADLGRGDTVTLSGTVSGWERLPERPVIRCDPVSEG